MDSSKQEISKHSSTRKKIIAFTLLVVFQFVFVHNLLPYGCSSHVSAACESDIYEDSCCRFCFGPGSEEYDEGFFADLLRQHARSAYPCKEVFYGATVKVKVKTSSLPVLLAFLPPSFKFRDSYFAETKAATVSQNNNFYQSLHFFSPFLRGPPARQAIL